MSEGSATDDPDAAALRPLTACVAGSGVMTLGMLQFLGQVWSAVPDPARQEMLVTVRVAFLGFLITLATLVLAWLGQRVGGLLWRSAIILFGLIAFAGTAFSVALGTGRALGKATPLAADLLPADAVLAFLGAALVALILLAGALGAMAVQRLLKGEEQCRAQVRPPCLDPLGDGGRRSRGDLGTLPTADGFRRRALPVLFVKPAGQPTMLCAPRQTAGRKDDVR